MTTLSIYELRKTIGLWKSRKITDSTISKLLDLYLGVTAYMNDEAVYPVENFYDLGLSLKFKNARCLVEAKPFVRHRSGRQCVWNEIFLLLSLESKRCCGKFTGNITGRITGKVSASGYI